MIKESNAIYSKGQTFNGIFILLKECLANVLPIQKFERYLDEMIEKSFPDQNVTRPQSHFICLTCMPLRHYNALTTCKLYDRTLTPRSQTLFHRLGTIPVEWEWLALVD